uniref:Uncharacterized protein n=1 Tax=viral metagenome TaxID=1070528 RepID=A0A6C0IJN7_9ZZZZ
MSAWTDFVTKFYHEKKEKNKDYQFKDALKDGAKEYKKGKVDKGKVDKGKVDKGKADKGKADKDKKKK